MPNTYWCLKKRYPFSPFAKTLDNESNMMIAYI